MSALLSMTVSHRASIPAFCITVLYATHEVANLATPAQAIAQIEASDWKCQLLAQLNSRSVCATPAGILMSHDALKFDTKSDHSRMELMSGCSQNLTCSTVCL